MILRPCFLVVDPEFAGSISTRKLVLETAKFNVITAYSYPEAVALLELFPNVHGVVVSADRRGEAEAFLTLVRDRYPGIKRVLTGDTGSNEVLADRSVENFSPDKLLKTLREMFPAAAATLSGNEERLVRKDSEAG